MESPWTADAAAAATAVFPTPARPSTSATSWATDGIVWQREEGGGRRKEEGEEARLSSLITAVWESDRRELDRKKLPKEQTQGKDW